MIRGDSWQLNPWLRCKSCGGDNLTIHRYIGDKGGTESVDIRCRDCETSESVVP